ncbi:hypothetical protein J6590_016064 [Homalodisca vitripennis]|nr:hypothetical protein J6590_016064 [Homalodisca vitripennis]
MLIDDPRYSEIFQKVEKTKYPTMPEVLQYIEDFFTKDSDTELIFGTDFTKDEREEIQMFARIRKLGYRFYASKATEKEADHIVVFIKRTPQYLRDKLIKSKEDLKYVLIPPSVVGKEAGHIVVFIKRTPQYLRDKLIKSKEDLKYVLIPPSVVGENYDSHINKYEQEHFKEEEKLVHNFWKSVRENYRKDSEENQVEMQLVEILNLLEDLVQINASTKSTPGLMIRHVSGMTTCSFKMADTDKLKELSYRKPLPILRQRSKSSDLVDNVTTDSRRPFSWCAALLYFRAEVSLECVALLYFRVLLCV